MSAGSSLLDVCAGCSLIADTRESAAAALNASNAYKAIIDAINKAWNASMEAVRAADEAKAVSCTCCHTLDQQVMANTHDAWLSVYQQFTRLLTYPSVCLSVCLMQRFISVFLHLSVF